MGLTNGGGDFCKLRHKNILPGELMVLCDFNAKFVNSSRYLDNKPVQQCSYFDIVTDQNLVVLLTLVDV